MNAQWNSEFNDNITGNWDVGMASDMAIDANGDFYIYVSDDNDTGNRAALIRINVPVDQAGEPDPSGQWTWSVAKFFNAPNIPDTYTFGMAFLDGALYILSEYGPGPTPGSEAAGTYGSTMRINTLSGEFTHVGTQNTNDGQTGWLDLAAAQLAPVINGTIFNDLDADGSRDQNEPGIPNLTVEIYEQTGTATPTLKGSVRTDSNGEYMALLPNASNNFFVRVKQPQINGLNATQTYAALVISSLMLMVAVLILLLSGMLFLGIAIPLRMRRLELLTLSIYRVGSVWVLVRTGWIRLLSPVVRLMQLVVQGLFPKSI